MDPKESQREHKFLYEEFEILISFANNYLIVEILNTETFQAYTISLTDDEIFKLSHQYFSKTHELFEVLTNFLEEAQETTFPLAKGLVFVKFKKRNVSFQFKIQLQNNSEVSETPKTLIFSIDLIPKNPNKELQKIQISIEDLLDRMKKIEDYFENFKTMNERITSLEQKYVEFDNYKPSKTVYLQENGVQCNDSPPILTFSSKINGNYYNFKNQETMIIRSVQSRKNHIVAWGSSPIKKTGLQFFYYKVEALNKSFQYINACIGVMTGNLYGKVTNLAEHNGIGCYFYGVNSQCIWINNMKTAVQEKYGKVGDVFKVIINFENWTIVWQIENKEIGRGIIDQKQIEEFDLYPAVTLAYPKESISLI